MLSKRVLVTGGAGYIGSHCVKALLEAGHRVLIVDNLSTGNSFAIKQLHRAEFSLGDIRDSIVIENAFNQFKPEAVIHLAAKAYVGESVSDPLSYFDNNVLGSIKLFNAMRKAGVRDLVFSSTCAVYGLPRCCPVDETQPTNPMSPYGVTKRTVEELLLALAKSNEMSSVVLRYFNAAGASADLSLGEWHQPETHLIPLAIRATNRDASPLLVFGTDYDTKDGTCERDYLHVEDLAEAHVCALNLLSKRGPAEVCETFNLGVGKPFSVFDILREVQECTGQTVAWRQTSRRLGDPASVFADPSKAVVGLGWRAKRGLTEMIRSAFLFEQAMRRKVDECR
ncbi:MAG: UDP-glucose 4-epimerase GalE [Betaproteobacteria bacterium]|nr:UDP-glucose 4-epimerase GalE [Betaproteobacteria bacterium]